MTVYRQFYHTADLGIEVFGGTAGELFTNAAFAMFDLITQLNCVELRETRRIEVEGVDLDDLLVNFLRESLYLFNGEHWLAKAVHPSRIWRQPPRCRGQWESLSIPINTASKRN